MDELSKDMSDKIALIRELVMIKVHTQCAEIRREMDDYHDQKLIKYRGSFSAETARQMEADALEAAREADTEASRRKAELKKKLYDLRLEKCSQVFAQARAELVSFTQTPEYAGFLEARLSAAKQQFGAEPLTLLLRPADLPFADGLRVGLPNCTVAADEQITLGGLMLKSIDGRIVDETLDTALEAEKTQFYHSCGAILTDSSPLTGKDEEL